MLQPLYEGLSLYTYPEPKICLLLNSKLHLEFACYYIKLHLR